MTRLEREGPRARSLVRQVLRGIGAVVATSLGIGVAGAMIAPGYAAPENRSVTAQTIPRPASAALRTVEQERTVVVRGAARRAVFVTPDAGAVLGSAFVFVHGSGPAGFGGPLERAHALAAQGIPVLVVEKVLDGYDWLHRDYSALGDDAAEAAEWLRTELGLGPDRVGLVGSSEGGWVALTAAAEHPELRGPLILESGPVVTPLEQSAYTLAGTWISALPPVRQAITGLLASGRTFLDYLDRDVRELLPRVTNPVIAVFGEGDWTVPIAEAIDRLRTGLPNEPSIVIAPGGHSTDLAAWAPLAAERAADPTRIPDGGETLAIGDVDVSRAAIELGAPTPPPPSWLLDPRWHLAIAAVTVGATVLLRRAAQRRRGRPAAPIRPAQRVN